MGQVDYALIVTAVALIWVIIRLPGNGGFNDWVMFAVMAAVPTIVFYYLLKAALIAMGVMQPI